MALPSPKPGKKNVEKVSKFLPATSHICLANSKPGGTLPAFSLEIPGRILQGLFFSWVSVSQFPWPPGGNNAIHSRLKS